MAEGISYNLYIDNSRDDKVWVPIPEEEYEYFDSLIQRTERSLSSGTKKEKGDSLETLMSYIYKRFRHLNMFENHRSSDNQIDHILEFIDGVVPTFIHENIGTRLIGESKNHKKAISSREVADLDELLRDKKSGMGIFSSYKSFSKGNSMWVNAEGKRRKLALWHNYNKIIIGFTLKELSSLKEKNFYSMLKQKYYQLIDELEDNNLDSDLKLPYHHRLYNSLLSLQKNGIISTEILEDCKRKIETQYGQIDL